MTNCYQIHHHARRTAWGQHRYTHKDFRIKLANELFAHSERIPPQQVPPTQEPLTHYVIPDTPPDHRHVILSGKLGACVVCKTLGIRPAASKKRKPLGELAYNISRPAHDSKKRRVKQKRTKHGCEVCKQYICKQEGCWERHLLAIQ